MAILIDMIPGLASDYSGAISVLKQMDGCVVLCGPEDCLANYAGMEETASELVKSRIRASDTNETQAILGMESSTVKRAVALAEAERPQFVALVGTPVSALVGADLHGIAYRVEQESGVPAIAVDATGFDFYAAGIEKAYDALAEHFVFELDDPSAEGRAMRLGSDDRIPNSVNILGYTHLDFCDDADLELLVSILQKNGEAPACVVGRDMVQALPRMLRAERSLVLSVGALPLARKLEQLAGIPWSCDLPIGGYGVAPAASQAPSARVLIVGDQVISHALRSFVERRYGASCDVATVHRLDRELAQPGDVRVKDERALAKKAQDGYNIVVADPMCISVVQDHQAFVGLPRPAVSSLVHQNNYVKLFGAGIVGDFDRAFARVASS